MNNRRGLKTILASIGMTLGIPPNVVMALLLGAFIIHGLQPGPLLIAQNPKLFWGIIASMYIGNLMLLVLNLPLVGLWVKLLKIPKPMLYAGILIFATVGVYGMQRAAMSAGSSSSTRRPRISVNGRARSGCRSSALSR